MLKPRKADLARNDIQIGFNDETITLKLDQIVPLKVITTAARTSTKYKQVLASIREVGIIEPPIVAPETKSSGKYILLDGHLRIEVLKDLGIYEVTCLVSTDDEAFTYNKHISRLSTVQEHLMILRAVEKGVPESKIAKALDLDIRSIIYKKNLLDGICPEATELLKDKIVPAAVFSILRKMKPVRQIEVATLMNDSGIYSSPYAKAFLAATPNSQLVEPDKPKKVKGLDTDQMNRMEGEMASLQREYRLIEENYGTDVLNLTLAKTYLTALLGNVKIVRYLAQHHPEILTQFQKIAEMSSLNQKENAA